MDFLDAAPIGASRLLDPIKFSLFCPTFPAWAGERRVFTGGEEEGVGRRRGEEGTLRRGEEGRREICSLSLLSLTSKGFSRSQSARWDRRPLEGP